MATPLRSALSNGAHTALPSLRPAGRLPTSPFKRPRRTLSSASAQANAGSSSGFRMSPTTAVLCFVPVLTGILGVWQIRRLSWKLNLIDEVDRNMAKDPMILPDTIDLDALPDFSFRRVLIKGRFLPTYLLLGPRVYEGFPGAHLIQPFERAPTDPTSRPSTILVNRGFITSTRADAIRAGSQVPPAGPNPLEPGGTGEVVIEGMLKREEGQGRFQPTNDPQGNMWFWSDVQGMAEAVGGEEKGVQAVLVDQIYDSSEPATMHLQQGVPVGRPPVIELRNMHATYAATWLSLSAATTVMLVRLIRKGRTTGAGATNPRLRSR